MSQTSLSPSDCERFSHVWACLTDVIVGPVHGVFLQAVADDVSAHERIRGAFDVFLVVILFGVDGGLGEATQVHVAWLALRGLGGERHNQRD